jgi:hypothetical protein
MQLWIASSLTLLEITPTIHSDMKNERRRIP